jgi:hypothetical protein
MSPSLTASFFMASALCFHFFGYEMARAASIALLAAEVNQHYRKIHLCSKYMYDVVPATPEF